MPYTITAESKPDYDQWGPDDFWSCQDWILWHKALKEKYGKDEANVRFVQAYGAPGLIEGLGSAHWDCRTFNQEFRNYAEANGFLTALFEGIGILTQPLGWVIDTSGNIIKNVGEGAQGLSKVLRIAIPVAAVLLIAGGAWWGYKTYIKPAGK